MPKNLMATKPAISAEFLIFTNNSFSVRFSRSSTFFGVESTHMTSYLSAKTHLSMEKGKITCEANKKQEKILGVEISPWRTPIFTLKIKTC